VQALAIGRITQSATRNTQAAFWDRVLSLPAPFFRRFSSGDLTMRVLAVDSLQQLMGGPVVSALLAAGFGLVNLVLMFTYSVELATVASVALLLTVTVLVVATWHISKNATSALEAGREANAWMTQLLAGLPKIRLAHAESRVQARYLEILRRQAAAMSRQTLTVGQVNAWFAFAATAVTAAFFLVIDHEWHGSPPISTADYLAFASAYALAFAGVQGLSVLISPIANAGPTFDLLRPLMEEQPETAADGQDPGRLTGRIELRDVTFRYDAQGPLVLKGVDLVVAPGELIALTGSSGAGKSTITRLLLGFDVPEEGRILFDGRDLADLDVSLVRRQMGVVVQSGTVMRDSVLKNILGGVAGDEAVAWSAAERAAIADDIRAMPMGMQSIIDAGNISGGQAQRILLARALARDPSVLILDEATSALDNVSQKVVTEAINALGVTRIVIAHRLSTIRAADRIVVMDQGTVVESGSYDELRAADGVFARLVARQLR
jgi:ABC-type bacteriocin/lantibiotic exporter with double-glycine peptidase domain